MTCPKCGSKEWKLASVIHAGGISTISTSSIGVGVSNDLGAGVGSTKGKQQTDLSKLAAPPSQDPKGVVPIFGALAFIAMIVNIILFGDVNIEEHRIFTFTMFFGIPLAILAWGGSYVTPTEEHKLALLEYAKKKMCMRCGAIYLDEKNSELSEHVTPATTKKCPFCAEIILAEAILCKHCHSKL